MLKKRIITLFSILLLLCSTSAFAQLSGSYTIGSDQDFSSLKEAFDILMEQGNTGNIEFLITNDLTENANVVLGFDPGVENTVTIRPLPGVAPVITFSGTLSNSFYDGALVIGLTEPNGGGAALTLTRNIIFDGSSEPGSDSRDMTLRTDSGALDANIFRIIGETDNIQFRNLIFEINQPANPFNTIRITSRSNSRHNDIRLINNEITNLNANSSRAIITDGIVSAQNGPVLTIENNDITARRYGIWLREVGGDSFIRGNTITVEHTGNFFAYGVLVDETASTETEIEIKNNIFHNSFSPNTMVGVRASGSASYLIAGNQFTGLSSGDGITRGVWAEAAGSYSIMNNQFSDFIDSPAVRFVEVRNDTGPTEISGNVFKNSFSDGDLAALLLNAPTAYTIEQNQFQSLIAQGALTGIDIQSGNNFLINANEFSDVRGDEGIQLITFSALPADFAAKLTNNMMTGFSSLGSDGDIFAVILRTPDEPATGTLQMYHNSIRLNPLNVNGSGWNYRGLSVFSNPRLTVDLQNNIIINADNNSSNVTSYAYFQAASAAANFSADYNFWYVENPQNDSTWLSRHGAESTNSTSLEDYQNSTGQDQNAVFKAVEFISSSDLRLSGSSLGDIDFAGLPLPEVTEDIDGTLRDADNPYRGAFEGPPLSLNERSVTFLVDMSVQEALGHYDVDAGDKVYLRGDFNDFSLDDEMSPGSENPLTFLITRIIVGEAGSSSEYKFFIEAGDGRALPNDGWELLGDDPMLNRSLTLGEAGINQTLDIVFFNDNDSLPDPDLLVVWPGDANNDGIVDEIDVLSLGTYWGATGPEREHASTDWAPQPAEPWEPEAATYANTNGDGVVNQTDLLAIGLNFGNIHANRSQNEVEPLITDLPNLIPGDELIIRIRPESPALLQGLAYDFMVQGQGVESLILENIHMGEWASGWQDSGSLISFSRHEMPEFRGAWAHKGITVPVSADLFFSVHFSVSENVIGGAFALNRIVVSTQDGQQVNWQEFDIEVIHTTGTLLPEYDLPVQTALHQNYPNPFNPQTRITFDLSSAETVTLEVMNILGQRVAALALNESLSAGNHIRTFNGSNLSSGIYLVRLHAGSQVFTRKMMLVK